MCQKNKFRMREFQLRRKDSGGSRGGGSLDRPPLIRFCYFIYTKTSDVCCIITSFIESNSYD
jgi:hypothetical protein